MLKKFCFFVVTLFLLSTFSYSQQARQEQDSGLKIHLGLLGGKAESSNWTRPRSPNRRQPQQPQQGYLRLTAVESGSPLSRAGLRVGDYILSADGDLLESNPIRKFAQELLEASGERLEITYRRGDNERDTRISCPRQDADRALDRGIDWLIENQSGDGGWPGRLSGTNGRVVITAVAGLALMADRGHSTEVRNAATFVAENAGVSNQRENRLNRGGGNWNQDNWGLSFGGVFLCEYLSQHNERAIRRGLQRIVEALEENQERSGGYGHGPGGPNALGYVELEVISNFAMATLGMAKDLRIDVDQDKLESGLRYIIDCQNPRTGSVGYSTRAGQQGMDGAGRTAGALWAFRKCGQTRLEAYTKMVEYFNGRMDDVAEGHASVYTHYLSAGLAARDLGRSAWGEFYERFEAELVMHAKSDGSFAPRPSAESHQMNSNSDATHGEAWCTAVNTLLLALNTRHDLETVVSSAGRSSRNHEDSDGEESDEEDESDDSSDRWRRWADAHRRR